MLRESVSMDLKNGLILAQMLLFAVLASGCLVRVPNNSVVILNQTTSAFGYDPSTLSDKNDVSIGFDIENPERFSKVIVIITCQCDFHGSGPVLTLNEVKAGFPKYEMITQTWPDRKITELRAEFGSFSSKNTLTLGISDFVSSTKTLEVTVYGISK